MIIYQRNINKRLLLLRLVFIGLAFLSIFLLMENLKDYAFTLIVLILFGAVFPITSIQIFSDKLEVMRYFVYGCIPSKTVFQANQSLLLDSFEMEFNDPATWADMESFHTEQLPVRKFRIKQEDQTGKEKKVLITMDNNEIKLVLQHFSISHALPIKTTSQRQA